MSITPSSTRWEQDSGSNPAFVSIAKSLSEDSTQSNPLLLKSNDSS